MQPISRLISSIWATVGLTVATLALVSWIVVAAPLEATLGTGIRSVYVHVGFTWVGMAGLYLAGAAGLAAAFWPNLTLARWMRAMGMVGLIFFAAGTAVSLWAQEVNWGAISWAEPITAAMLRFVAVGIIVHILLSWPIGVRIQGGLSLALAILHRWSVASASLILHPSNPIGSSNSSNIQTTFVAVGGVSLLLAVWLVLVVHQRLVQEEFAGDPGVFSRSDRHFAKEGEKP